MKVVQVPQYETTDGCRFVTREEAAKYETRCALTRLLELGAHAEPAEVFDAIWDNRREVAAIFLTSDLPCEGEEPANVPTERARAYLAGGTADPRVAGLMLDLIQVAEYFERAARGAGWTPDEEPSRLALVRIKG